MNLFDYLLEVWFSIWELTTRSMSQRTAIWMFVFGIIALIVLCVAFRLLGIW